MTDTGVVDLYPDLVRFGRFDLDIFDGKILSRFPSDGCLKGFVSNGMGPRDR